MSELLDIIISAVDQASDVFESITGTANDMQSQLTSIDTSEMNEIADGADGAEQELLEADEAVQSLSNDLSIIDSSMLMQLGQQVGELGGQAEGMAQDMNAAAISVGQLATNVDMAEPQMISLINNISNATFPQEEAIAYANALNQMGVSADKLGDSATNMDRINDATGIGYDKVVKLTQGLQSMGITADNLPASFNAIAYAQSNVTGGVDTLQRTLMRQAATINEYGLNVDQVVLIMNKLSQQGVSTTKMGTELSNVLKENDGDIRAIEESLGMESGALENATSVTGEYEGQLMDLASEEAEHKTLLDQIGAAWEDVSLSVGSALSPLLSIAGVIGSVGSFGLQVSGLQKLATLIPRVTTAVRTFSATQAISNAIEGEGAIARVASAIGITTEAAAAEGATVAFGGLAIAEGAALWPILAIIAAIALFVAAAYEVGKAFGWWTDVGSMLAAISDGVRRLWEAFINHPDVQGTITFISQALSVLWGWIVQAGQAVMEFFGITNSGGFDIVAMWINNIGLAWQAMTAPLRAVVGFVQNVINVFNLFRTNQMDLPAFIFNILTALANAYNTIFNMIISYVVRFAAQLLQRAISAATNFVNNIINRIKQLPGRVYSALISVVTQITSAGQRWITAATTKAKGIVTGVKTGLSGMTDTINGALSGVVNAITSPFQSAYDTVCGIADNIKQKVEDALNDAKSLIDARGGEEADGRQSLLIGAEKTPTITSSNQEDHLTVDINQNINLDLSGVPAHIDTNTLIQMLSDKKVLNALTSNNDFQTLDAKVKERLNLKIARSRGV